MACGSSDSDPLPEVAVHHGTDCEVGLTLPTTQVSGGDLAQCMPAQGEFTIEVKLKVTRHGRVVAVRLPESVAEPFAACIRRVAQTMEFLLVEPCEPPETEITLTFVGPAGEPVL